MTTTLEINGQIAQIVDTDDGVKGVIKVAASLGVTKWTGPKRITAAAGASDVAISFDGITAAKGFIFRSDGSAALTFKLNGGTTVHTFNPLALMLDSAGGITALTYSNPGAADVPLDVLLAG